MRILGGLLICFYSFLFYLTKDHLTSFLIESTLLISFALLARDWGPGTQVFPKTEESLAIREHRVVSILYKDAQGRTTKREIEIYPCSDRRYVQAFCRKTNEPRTFRRDRILVWEILEQTFTDNPKVAEWFATEGQKPLNLRTRWARWQPRSEQLHVR